MSQVTVFLIRAPKCGNFNTGTNFDTKNEKTKRRSRNIDKTVGYDYRNVIYQKSRLSIRLEKEKGGFRALKKAFDKHFWRLFSNEPTNNNNNDKKKKKRKKRNALNDRTISIGTARIDLGNNILRVPSVGLKWKIRRTRSAKKSSKYSSHPK